MVIQKISMVNRMARGGAREGAGRPKGVKSEKVKRRVEISEAAAALGVSPLDVMLETMRELYALGEKSEACKIAKDAAPYIHPRLTTGSLNLEGGITLAVVTGVDG